VDVCVACGAPGLHPILDLGQQPLANSFVTPEAVARAAPEPTFPLGTQWCRDCRLMQLTYIVPPELLFATYLYVPSTSSTWLRHCETLADHVRDRADLRAGDLVVEFGSNDGTLLRAFQRRGLRVLGVEPATNLAERATDAGVPTLARYFGEEVGATIRADYGPARAIVSTNVLAHVPDPLGVLRGVAHLLAPDGVYVNESPGLRQMVAQNEFDTIYHEHVSYFSLHALDSLCARAGLAVVDASLQAVHGGTLRTLAVPGGAGVRPSAAHRALAAAELDDPALELAGLRRFAARAAAVRERLPALIEERGAAGARIAGYGATAKGNTLLTYCGLTAAHVAFIADRNPLKQGLLTPGAHIPVVSPDHLAAHPPDVLLLLAWNLADEIRRQLAWFTERGGAFLIPVPEPRLDR
jgi:novobiocin biosynthesis protein NovU/D-mycarose 3-C-methyltransferase